MQCYIVGASTTAGNVTSRLKVDIILPGRRRGASQEVQLPTPRAGGSGDNCVSFKAPLGGSSCRVEGQRLVRGRGREDVQVNGWGT